MKALKFELLLDFAAQILLTSSSTGTTLYFLFRSFCGDKMVKDLRKAIKDVQLKTKKREKSSCNKIYRSYRRWGFK